MLNSYNQSRKLMSHNLTVLEMSKIHVHSGLFPYKYEKKKFKNLKYTTNKNI